MNVCIYEYVHRWLETLIHILYRLLTITSFTKAELDRTIFLKTRLQKIPRALFSYHFLLYIKDSLLLLLLLVEYFKIQSVRDIMAMTYIASNIYIYLT